jgi:hypothetical protein
MNHPSQGLMTLKVLLVSIFYKDTYFSVCNEPNFILMLTFKEDGYTCQLLITSNCLNWNNIYVFVKNK